jgi:hypothetical protein
MSYGRAVQVTRILGLVLAGIYAVAAIVVFLGDWSTGEKALAIAFLGGGGFLILLGFNIARISRPLSTVFVCIGAAAGAFPLVGLIIPPLAAAVLIAMSIALARRPTEVASGS